MQHSCTDRHASGQLEAAASDLHTQGCVSRFLKYHLQGWPNSSVHSVSRMDVMGLHLNIADKVGVSVRAMLRTSAFESGSAGESRLCTYILKSNTSIVAPEAKHCVRAHMGCLLSGQLRSTGISYQSTCGKNHEEKHERGEKRRLALNDARMRGETSTDRKYSPDASARMQFSCQCHHSQLERQRYPTACLSLPCHR
jgi:hypothetical protein